MHKIYLWDKKREAIENEAIATYFHLKYVKIKEFFNDPWENPAKTQKWYKKPIKGPFQQRRDIEFAT